MTQGQEKRINIQPTQPNIWSLVCVNMNKIYVLNVHFVQVQVLSVIFSYYFSAHQFFHHRQNTSEELIYQAEIR